MTAGARALLCVSPGAGVEERVLRRLRTVVDAVPIVEPTDDAAAAADAAGWDGGALVVTDVAGVGSGHEPDDVIGVLAGLQGVDAASITDPVSDAVKRVRDGRVVASVERGDLALPRLPVAVGAGVLAQLRADAGPVPAGAILAVLLAAGRRVRLVPSATAPASPWDAP